MQLSHTGVKKMQTIAYVVGCISLPIIWAFISTRLFDAVCCKWNFLRENGEERFGPSDYMI